MHSLPLPRVRQHLLLGWVVACAVLLVLTAAVLFVAGARVDDSSANYYIPKGYRDNVTTMARGGAIRHDRKPPQDIRSFMPPWGRLLFDKPSASDRQIRFFEESKRLQNDLGEFNETGGGFFEVGLDGAIHIARQHHNFALPYPKKEGWTGRISLGGEELPSLVGPNFYLGFAATDESGAPTAEDYRRLNLDTWSRPSSGQTHHRANAYEVLGDEAVMVRLFLVGDHVALQLTNTSEAEVRLNGDLINRAGSQAVRAFMARTADLPKAKLPNNTAPLRDGDRLRLRHVRSGREIALRYGRHAEGVVSRAWQEDGRKVSVVDPELAEEMPYLRQFQESLNRFFRAHPKPGELRQPAVRLTFDRALHAGVNRVFLDGVRGFDARRSAVRGIQLEPASVCIINALTGDVLAMPSYPAPADLQSMRERAQSGTLSGVTDSKLRRLGLNQNLTLIPIGSTTKPIFASAVWDTRPDLMKLVIQEPADSRHTLLGYRLAAPYGTVGTRTVDSSSFLRMSSNDYTLHLGLLILARDARIGANGSPVFPQGKADLSAYFRGDSIPGGLDRPDIGAFPKMRDCFDIALVENMADGAAGQWDISVLAPMLKQIGVKDAAMLPPSLGKDEDPHTTQVREVLYNHFSGIMPERTNLQLDTISSVRGRYTSLLLGGGTNYWSNLKLAEAYARLGTGRKVQARITTQTAKEPAVEDYPPLDLKPATLAAVHKGMQQCAEGVEGSTAARISDSIKSARRQFESRGLKLFALAKTGTASRRAAQTRNGVVIDAKRECAAFCLFLEVQDKSGKALAALSTATYLQDRAATRGSSSPRNSAVAVQLTEDFFSHLVDWLNNQPAVKQAIGK
jgi:cell division protein FtsI/penicillin-binding protein 2